MAGCCTCSRLAAHWCPTDCKYFCKGCASLHEHSLLREVSYKALRYAERQYLFENDIARYDQKMSSFENALMGHWDALAKVEHEQARVLADYDDANKEILNKIYFRKKQRVLLESINNVQVALDFNRQTNPPMALSLMDDVPNLRLRNDHRWLLHPTPTKIFGVKFPNEEQYDSDLYDLEPGCRMTYFNRSFVLTGGLTHNSQCLQFFTNFRFNTELRPIPIGSIQHTALVYKERLYIIGGKRNLISLKTVYSLDPDFCNWEAHECLNVARFNCSATVMNDKIYVVGGIRQYSMGKIDQSLNLRKSTIQLVEVFDGNLWTNFSLRSSSFVQTALIPGRRDKLLIFGSFSSLRHKSEGFYYELNLESKRLRRKISSYKTDMKFIANGICYGTRGFCLNLNKLLTVSQEFAVNVHTFM